MKKEIGVLVFDSDVELAPNYNQDELAFGGVVTLNVTYKFDSAKNEFIADQIKVEP